MTERENYNLYSVQTNVYINEWMNEFSSFILGLTWKRWLQIDDRIKLMKWKNKYNTIVQFWQIPIKSWNYFYN